MGRRQRTPCLFPLSTSSSTYPSKGKALHRSRVCPILAWSCRYSFYVLLSQVFLTYRAAIVLLYFLFTYFYFEFFLAVLYSSLLALIRVFVLFRRFHRSSKGYVNYVSHFKGFSSCLLQFRVFGGLQYVNGVGLTSVRSVLFERRVKHAVYIRHVFAPIVIQVTSYVSYGCRFQRGTLGGFLYIRTLSCVSTFFFQFGVYPLFVERLVELYYGGVYQEVTRWYPSRTSLVVLVFFYHLVHRHYLKGVVRLFHVMVHSCQAIFAFVDLSQLRSWG